MYKRQLPVSSGVLPGSSDNVQRSYFITDEKGNKIVTPEGYYLVWDTDANMAKKVSLQAGVINIPVVCGEITTGTQITVTGVTLNSDSGESYTAGNDNGTMLTIDSNPYATQGICNDLYAAFNGLVYLPFTATKSLYDPATELGDQVKIGELVHSVMFNVKLTLDHNFRADIEAPNLSLIHISVIIRLETSSPRLRWTVRCPRSRTGSAAASQACLTGFRPLRITSRSPFPLWLAVSCPTRPQQPQQAAAVLTSARPLKRPMTRSQALLRRS